MMRTVSGVLAVAVAALIVCCNAEPPQDQEVSGSDHNLGERFGNTDHKVMHLDPVGEGNLVRQVREIQHPAYLPYVFARRYDYVSPYGGRRGPIDYSGYYRDGLSDDDRSGVDAFLKKRNFDEIDRSSLPFPFKRFYQHQRGRNYFDIDIPVSRYDKKRYTPDYPMDEIDLSSFPIGSKRSGDSFPLARNVL